LFGIGIARQLVRKNMADLLLNGFENGCLLPNGWVEVMAMDVDIQMAVFTLG
jgi:hypothetical protein